MSKVALCAIAKEEELYIEEWVKYHLGWGFDQIVIYNNDDDQTILPRILSKYIAAKKVIIMPFPGQYMQIPAYKDFFRKFRDVFEYSAIWDVDEFLVLKKHQDIKQLIKEYFNEDNVGGFVFNLHLFGSNNHMVYIDEPVVKRFTKRLPNVTAAIKCMYKTKTVAVPSAHYSEFHPGYITIDSNRAKLKDIIHPIGDDVVAQINHYISKSQEECKKRSIRGRACHFGHRPMSHCKNGEKFSQIEDLLALNFYNNLKI